MKRALATSMGVLLLSVGCAPQQPWTPTVDTYGSARAQYLSRDMADCRQLARQVSGDPQQEAVQGAVTGGLVGAAAGAAIGAAFGSPGRGAAVGAAAGGIGTGASRAARSDAAYQRAFSNCMRQRGHRVVN